ncbi:unnamed protein product [Lactuca virosa]|uniref:Morc S5 domain-containing protein n=1 Tax=Lactuca virosa TaxID=75947 RepID=A0AAU9LD74_9ASTR|nr:unnamed protein product [Lactuca virosa]
MGSLQLEDIGPHGTKVLIYNLWLNDEGIYELNFDEDDEDIKLNDFTKAFRTLQRCQETWIKLVLKKKKSFQNLQSFTRRMVVTIIETSLMVAVGVVAYVNIPSNSISSQNAIIH